MSDANFKPVEKYRALEEVIAKMKAEKVLRSPNVHLASVLGYGGKRPDNRFRDTIDPQNYEKRFNDKEWKIIIDEIYNIDPLYAQMYYNTYLSHVYGFNVIDDAMTQDIGKTSIENVCNAAKSVIIEAADIMRVELETITDGTMSEEDSVRLCKEADDVIMAVRAYKEKVKGAVEKQ